jgi:hypothetical protein
MGSAFCFDSLILQGISCREMPSAYYIVLVAIQPGFQILKVLFECESFHQKPFERGAVQRLTVRRREKVHYGS